MSKLECLWTAAQIALCVTAVSSAALAQSWDATADSGFPTSMVWDETADVTIDATNDGDTHWDTDYALWSVAGMTTPVDRWGLEQTPAAGITPPVAIDASTTFEFTIAAPPITTLEYLEAAQVTSAYDTLECNWVMHDAGDYITTDIVEKDIVISRFTDDQPGSPGGWARHSIEMCAGRVPFIVKGYPDGSFGPQVTVSRDIMAVFMFRAAKIAATTPAEATFDDVPTDHWAYTAIESLAAAGIVEGYNPTTYAPSSAVTRAQQAVFGARTLDYELARDEDGNSTLTEDPFLDVPWDFWAGPEIQAGVDAGVINGYPDGYYRPTVILSRDQMAVFVDRAFIVPTGQPVVLGGPDVTDVDLAAWDTDSDGILLPGDADYYGWSHQHTDPSYAYVVFDALRLGENLAAGPNELWDVRFECREVLVPTNVVAAKSFTITAAQIAAAKTAASSSGDAYYVLFAPAPTVPDGVYWPVVIVEDPMGETHEVHARLWCWAGTAELRIYPEIHHEWLPTVEGEATAGKERVVVGGGLEDLKSLDGVLTTGKGDKDGYWDSFDWVLSRAFKKAIKDMILHVRYWRDGGDCAVAVGVSDKNGNFVPIPHVSVAGWNDVYWEIPAGQAPDDFWYKRDGEWAFSFGLKALCCDKIEYDLVELTLW
ncbi:MAG: S-layer homology domain-containing protein [Armatimonadota bacterium]|nr:MAG: S-layer homology domain-containing protein [Armatimonadota bacterium]